jgi:hypothetical protein
LLDVKPTTVLSTHTNSRTTIKIRRWLVGIGLDESWPLAFSIIGRGTMGVDQRLAGAAAWFVKHITE